MVKLCCGLFLVKSGQCVFLQVYVFLTILDAAQHVVVAQRVIFFYFLLKNTQNQTDVFLLLGVYL